MQHADKNAPELTIFILSTNTYNLSLIYNKRCFALPPTIAFALPPTIAHLFRKRNKSQRSIKIKGKKKPADFSAGFFIRRRTGKLA
jgi:hypothetical protein